MAQVFPTSPEVIYNTLVADVEFMGYLGTYEFQGDPGTAIPAISIVTPGSDLPSLRNVQGIECVIQDSGDFRRLNYLSNDADVVTNWSVFLVCWKPASGSDMSAAVKRVCQIFSGAFSIETVAAADGLGALVQTFINIPSDRPIVA